MRTRHAAPPAPRTVTRRRRAGTTKIVAMRSELRAVRTGGVPVVVDLTDECAEFVAQEVDGLLHVFVPHATAGIALIETGGRRGRGSRRGRAGATQG